MEGPQLLAVSGVVAVVGLVGDVGYSSHGWRLAKRETEAAAS